MDPYEYEKIINNCISYLENISYKGYDFIFNSTFKDPKSIELILHDDNTPTFDLASKALESRNKIISKPPIRLTVGKDFKLFKIEEIEENFVFSVKIWNVIQDSNRPEVVDSLRVNGDLFLKISDDLSHRINECEMRVKNEFKSLLLEKIVPSFHESLLSHYYNKVESAIVLLSNFPPELVDRVRNNAAVKNLLGS